MKLIVVVLLFTCAFYAKSQDTIWFLSGERLITSKYEVKTDENTLVYYNKRDKQKLVSLDYVYSINEKGGYKKIYYQPATIDNEQFSVSQMGSFIQGEFDADVNYKARGAFAVGFVSGCGGVIGLSYVGNLFYSPLLPAVTSTVVGVINVSDKAVHKRCPNKIDDKYYIEGYKEVAKQKRTAASIKGGVLGIFVGVVSVLAILNL